MENLITLFGSCRLNEIKNHNNLNNLITYTHNTKEVIQLINFLNGDLRLHDPYNKICFRTGIMKNENIEFSDAYKDLFRKSQLIIIEICSIKKYIYDNYYIHHLCVDNRFSGWNINHIKNNFYVEKQDCEEIENDILKINKILSDKKVIFVSHYNSQKDNKYIEERNNLIILLNDICKKHKINFINPTEVLKEFTQKKVMNEDLGHYTSFGITKFSEYMNKYIEDLFKTSA